ncbi:MAG: DUF1499 domain-containing protein [Microcystaceae cyanobacterium]
MSHFLSILLGSLLFFSLPTTTLATPNLAALPIVRDIFAGNPPTNLGLEDGHLSACPASPNCVLSQDPDESHQIEPISYQGDSTTIQETLLKVLSVVPNTTVVDTQEDYIRAQSVSKIMGFTDDLEFYFVPNEKIIHIRSASRLGESDLGVNRRRLEQIRLALEDLNA